MKHNILGLTFLIFCAFFMSRVSAETLLVYPDGSGNYANIQRAINAAVNGDTVALADGIFAGRGNRDIKYYGKEIVVCSQNGDASVCIIDVEGEDGNNAAERGFIFENDEGSLSVLRDLTIIHSSADGPCPACEGGGVFIENSSPTIINVIFRDNNAATGAGMMCAGGSPIIRDCVFADNEAISGAGLCILNATGMTVSGCLFINNLVSLRGAGVSIESGSEVSLVNCTVANNTSQMGSGIAAWESDYILLNTIISHNKEGEAIYIYGETSDITITYSDIYGNTGGDWVGIIADMLGVDGNISEDPLYADTTGGDFRLTEDSPCVDTGDPNSPHDPDNTTVDMGALFYDQSTDIDDSRPALPEQIRLLQNYPNPFNATTSIKFELDKKSPVKLVIFDILGREIATLVDEVYIAGSHQVTWDADVASGIYLYRLTGDNYDSTKKMLLIK